MTWRAISVGPYSLGVFEIFHILNASYDVPLRPMFIAYAGVGVFVLVTAIAFWPDKPHKPPPPPVGPGRHRSPRHGMS
jgi:hypothetical protein